MSYLECYISPIKQWHARPGSFCSLHHRPGVVVVRARDGNGLQTADQAFRTARAPSTSPHTPYT